MSELTGFIPAGGLGSRLRPHTLDTPKPLLLMGSPDRRIIDWPVEASTPSCTHVWVSTDYLAEQVDEHLSGTSNVTTLKDPAILGSAGSLLQHYPTMSEVDSDGDMLVLPADHVYENFSVADFWAAHQQNQADITLLTVPPKLYGDYVSVDGNQALAVKKMRHLGAVSTTGIFIIRNAYLMDWARRNLKAGWEDGSYNVYHDIICPAVGKAAVGHYFMDEASGHWEDAGVPERYLASNMRLSSGQNVISHEASIHPAAQLEGCVVLGQTTIDGRATIRNAILSTQRGQLAITQVGAVSTDSRKDTECGKPLAAKSYLGIPA